MAAPPAIRPGMFGNIKFDAIAGFPVFLIAMPLCLAIAKASGFPPTAGIWTAVAGGLLATWVSDSQLTTKRPAAGLIVILAGAVANLGQEFVPPPTDVERQELVATGLTSDQVDRQTDDRRAEARYKPTLGIGVVSGVIQVLLGLLKAGRLVDCLPLTPVHGMLASIGIIIAKQVYAVSAVAEVDVPKVGRSLPEPFGVAGGHPAEGGGEPPGAIQSLMEFPARVTHFNPEILVIGGDSLVILFAHYFMRNKWVKVVPAQLVVLVVAMLLGGQLVFDLDHEHKHLLPTHLLDGEPDNGEVVKWPQFQVSMPNVVGEPQKAFFLPDFRGMATLARLKWTFLFVMIGSLESLLSAKVFELIDPWRRKTSCARELIGWGWRTPWWRASADCP